MIKISKLNQTQRYIIVAVVALLIVSVMVFLSLRQPNTSDEPNVTEGEQPVSQTDDERQNTVTTGELPSQVELRQEGNTTYYVNNIANYDSTVTNLPQAETDAIYFQLNYTLGLNGVNRAVTDAVIRDGSYSQRITDTEHMIYETAFIIDIPSLKQSYSVIDKYSPLPMEESGLTDYTTLVLCPDADDLIYSEFQCTDRVKWEKNH